MSNALRAYLTGRLVAAGLLALVGSSLVATPSVADDGLLLPAGPKTGQSASVDAPTDQFIVKFKETASITSAEEGKTLGRAATRAGSAVAEVRNLATGANVLRLSEKITSDRSQQVLQELRTNPDVEFAEPDSLMQPLGEPNDTFYPLQWDMWEETGGMRMPEAWTASKGAGVTVAVIDTGITNHSDLNANVLPGYDMISNVYGARDADGRDSNPQDEGDWTSDGMCGSGLAGGYSSWHGTHVAGTVAAIADNGQGVTGVAPQAKILPVRALGVCGGYTSDIADAIIWSAGGEVPGVPVNNNPARVINLSLGGINPCSSTYQSAIDFAVSAGAAVVVAAGNSSRPAADSAPANCNNVIAVAATTRHGGRAPYSNYGPTVDVSAPGGDMSQNVQNGIASTLNNGAYGPVAENYVYSQGTSMAAPHVAGLAALMFADTESLSPATVEDRLKKTARPISSCYEGCGAGLVDAAKAVGIPDPQAFAAATPSISGVLSEYHQVTAATGDWGSEDIAFTYQWLSDGRPIDGARGPSYNLSFWEIGSYISVSVTGSKAGFVTETRTSERVGSVTFDWQGRKVIPAAVAFTDLDGTDDDTYTIPGTQGVDYLVGNSVVEAGTHPGAGEVRVTARQQPGYTLYWNAPTSWSTSFKASPFHIVPAPVEFSDAPGTTRDSFSVPKVDGVQYARDGQPLAPGTYPAAGTVSVTAAALEDYVFRPESVTEWSATFDAAPGKVSPADVKFNDENGTTKDTFTVPVTEGVEYLVGDAVKAAGTYPGSGTVTVKARAVTDYVLADGVTAQWSHEFKATPYQVTPAGVTFVDVDGTAKDSFTVPSTVGVEYLVGDAVKAAGTYPGSGPVTVKARAVKDYVLADGVTAQWSHEFKATPYQVTPAGVTFVDVDGTAKDSFTVPSTVGVEYLVGDAVKAAGTYPGSGTVTVKARAVKDYVLADGVTAQWSHEFRQTPYEVVPAPVSFADKPGTSEDAYTVPAMDGVEYLVGDKVQAAGTFAGSGTVTVKARAVTDYVLAPGAVTEWAQSFSAKHPAVPGSMIPVTPFRALDTRNSAAVRPDGTVSFQVAGVGGVPAGASAVVFNMTVADAKSFGFVTAYASGSNRPDASNLNFDKGQIVANSVTVPVGADGKVTLFNRSTGATQLLADVSGYYLPGTPTAAGAFASIAPKRFLDTRSGAAVGPDKTVSFQVAGANGIPCGVSAVVMNLTVAEARSFGFITAYPSGTSRPNASNVNFDAGQIIPNAVTVPVGADGKVTLFNRSNGATHLLADVSGYYLAGTPSAEGTFQAVAPTRFLDTRSSTPARADSSVSFQVGGAKGIPADASAVVFNLTVADASSFGFVTAHASGTNRPNASNVNFDARQIVPNLVLSPVGGDGKVSLFNRSSGATHLLADVSGYFLAG